MMAQVGLIEDAKPETIQSHFCEGVFRSWAVQMDWEVLSNRSHTHALTDPEIETMHPLATRIFPNGNSSELVLASSGHPLHASDDDWQMVSRSVPSSWEVCSGYSGAAEIISYHALRRDVR